MKKNLKIFHIEESNLKGFTTTEKDKKRGTDRFPPEEFRFRESDLLHEEKTQGAAPGELTFEDGQALRQQQF